MSDNVSRLRSVSEVSNGSSPSTPMTEMGTPLLETTITTTARSLPGQAFRDSSLVPLDNPVEKTTTTIQHVHSKSVQIEENKDGSLRLMPVASGSSKKSRISKVQKIVTFAPRISQFDRTNPSTAGDTFRGFHTLFWILMAIMTFRTFATSYRENGQLVTFNFGKLISQDGIVLAISDGILVGATVLCVPYIKLVKNGWIRYRPFGSLLQHLAQTAYLALAIRWTFHRQWPWVQSGYLTLHSLTMLMKIHSYCSTNGVLSEKSIQLKKLRKQLDAALEASPNGRTGALKEARKYLETEQPPTSPSASSSSVSTITESALHAPDDTKLSRRRSSANEAATANGETWDTQQLMDILFFHPDPQISDLASQSLDLLDDLTSRGKDKIVWPANVTYLNFLDYLRLPTLVYELDYPRTSSIRPLYVIEKTLATFGTFSLLYIITEHYIIPITKEKNTFWGMALDLAAPFMVNYILLFYIIFECICNGFAELSCFADRQFYEDWWNSTSFDEFSRKWNKPVHTFLLRHVYTSTKTAYKLSKFQAAFVTFLLSACLHELVMAVVTKKLRLYLFGMQMAQLPLIMVGRAKIFKQNPGLGNLFFWIGLLSGFPLLAVGYLRF